MKPYITRAGWIRITILIVIGIITWPLTPGGMQWYHMHLAEKHAEKILPLIKADSRFQHVSLGTYTGGGGSLSVSGTVATNKDRAALMKFVTATHCPVNVIFLVISAEQISQLREKSEIQK